MRSDRIISALILVIAGCLPMVSGQSLPKGATVLEERNLPGRHRKLILWMPNAVKHPFENGEFYTCPDQSRGSFYSGDARVTLIDTVNKRVINILRVKSNDDSVGPVPEAADPIDLPYAIRSGSYYYVPNGSVKDERKPQIMDLKDYNGDGKAMEFPLYDAEACMGLGTTLIGYSIRQDRVIQYPINVRAPEGTTREYWLDYLFSKQPTRPGHWRYDIDYRGREGTLDMFTVKYDPKHEAFVATIKRRR